MRAMARRAPSAVDAPATPWVLAVALLTSSCGATQRYAIDESGYRVQQQGGSPSGRAPARADRMARRAPRRPFAAPVSPAAIRARPGAMPRRRIKRPVGQRVYKARSSKYERLRGAATRTGDDAAGGQRKGKRVDLEEPTVVYLGFLRLRVKRRLPAVDRITGMVQEAGGYIQTLQPSYMIVRVPAKDFDEAMTKLATVGEVLDRRVKALDVSDQFTDLGARLAVFVRARERLLALLRTTRDVEERLRIVQEVKRLSERIESLESTLATLRNLVSYFTITIQLEPIVSARQRAPHRSPFPWIRRLRAHLTTIRDGMDELRMTPPKGFVLFEGDEDWRAQSADTSILRAGRINNEPRGDSAFWLRAVGHEMEGRDEVQVAAGSSGPVRYAIYRNKDPRPRYWLIGVHARGEELFVIEAFMPNEAAYEAHARAIVGALASFEVK